MAAIISSVDETTLTINGYIFTSFHSGDVVELAPENDFSTHVDGTDDS